METAPKEPVVLSIVPSPLLPPVDGGQKHTYGMLDALGKITLLVCITDTKSETAGHSFELLPKIEHRVRKYLSFGNFKYIVNKIIEIKPVAVLLEKPFMGPIVYMASRKTGIPFFIHAHNIEYLRYRSLGKWWYPLLYFWESFTYSKAKAIFFVSEEDRRLAIEKFKIPDDKCHISAYGIPQTKVLERPAESIRQTKASVGIKPDEKVIMFFGALKYLPNIEALEIIINELLPRLQKKIKTPYKVLVCGGGISADYEKQLKGYSDKHLIYAGFVPDIDEYTGSADVVINPVLSAGGVRTRVVEALGFNKTVVSTITGAHGIDARLCGKKLKVVADNDWDSFTEKIAEALSEHEKTPDSFFDHYSWQAIANELKQVLQS